VSATILSSTGLIGYCQGLGKGITLILLDFIRVWAGLFFDKLVDSWEIGKLTHPTIN
jgi:hypothetical protein